MISKKQASGKIRIAVPILLLLFTFSVIRPENIFGLAPKVLSSETEFVRPDDFERIFREGKDLIDQEEWKQASVKFNELIAKYPDNKSTDAALYWLAFSYKKQKSLKLANETLDRLLKDFPGSSWAIDARVMKYEIVNPTTWIERADSKPPRPAVGPKEAKEKTKGVPHPNVTRLTIIQLQGEAENMDFGTRSNGAKVPLDQKEEMRLAAFQSLLTADTKRGIETLGSLLSPEKASENLRYAALRSFISPRLLREMRLETFLPQLRESLISALNQETSLKIRKEIIYTLANINDDQSVKYISDLYASESNPEIKKRIINSLSDASIDLFGYSLKSNSKVPLIRKIAVEKLKNILRSDPEAELRRLAFSTLQRIGNGSLKKGFERITVPELISVYDAEKDEELKVSVIGALGQMKEEQAFKKLMDIAKNDASNKLKLEAVHALRKSKNPEVLKFLEELIK